MNGRNLTIYTISHFAVDMACFFILYSGLAAMYAGQEALALGLLLYNALAFGLQMLIGLYTDKRAPRLRADILGAVLVLCALALRKGVWTALALCAVGNALFHVGAGADTLRRSGGRASPNGIFVAFGAPGVALGVFLGKTGCPAWAVGAAMGVCLLAMCFFCDTAPVGVPMARAGKTSIKSGWAIALICLLAIALRAYVGCAVKTPWQAVGAWAFLGPLCACAGKAAGGFLGDRIGFRRAGVWSIAVSALLICVFGQNAACMAAGLLLFNIAMPLTLCAVYAQLPDMPGFAFGLTTMALLLGTAPTFLFVLGASALWYVLASLILFCAFLLFISLGDKPKEV